MVEAVLIASEEFGIVRVVRPDGDEFVVAVVQDLNEIQVPVVDAEPDFAASGPLETLGEMLGGEVLGQEFGYSSPVPLVANVVI